MSVQRFAYLCLLGLVLSSLVLPGHAMAVMVNQPAPDFTLPSTGGGEVTLSQYRGKKMVLLEFYAINFGAT